MPLLSHPRFPFLAAALAVALCAPSLCFGFIIDDWVHRLILKDGLNILGQSVSPFGLFTFADGDPAPVRATMDYGVMPWWTLETVRLSFWRPVTVLTHMLDYALWPDSPFRMHVHSLLWLAACVLAAGRLYRTVFGATAIAGLATLLFAVEDAHAMPAGWIANRNELIALCFGLIAIHAHIRWRATARGRHALLAVCALLLSLLAKESGVAVLGYLLAYAVFLERGALFRRLRSVAHYGVILVVWRVVYRALGHGIEGAELYRDPLLSPLAFLGAVARHAPVLFLGQWALPPSDVHVMLPETAQLALAGAGAVFVLFWLLLFAGLLKHSAEARFWAGGMALSFIPVSATFPTDRMLLFTGVGAMALLSLLAARAFAEGGQAIRGRLFKTAAGALLVLHLVLAPILLPVRTVAVGVIGEHLNTALESGPLEDDLAGRTVVILDAPVVIIPSYLPLVRMAKGLNPPEYVRSLGPNSPLPRPITVHREDEHTLVLDAEAGYRWLLVRNREHPASVGEHVELPGMTAEVLSVTPEGWPRAVRYRFDTPLEDARYLWLEFVDREGAFREYQPPAVGETRVLNTN